MMSHARHLVETLEEHPLYALMRGVARFSPVRTTVTLGRHLTQRRSVRNFIRNCETRRNGTFFSNVAPKKFAAQIEKDGVVFGLNLPVSIVETIRSYAEHATCYADREVDKGFTLTNRAAAETALGKPILLAQYFNIIENCPAVAGLANDPVLLEIAARYLQSMPKLVGANLWWTFPVKASEEDRSRHAHLFHRDVDDFRFFKFFFYLTDVEPGDGAHVCVIGSHHNPPSFRLGDKWIIRRYSDQEINSCYSREAITEISGAAGTGFAENTLCVHKGLTPTRAPRLLLQLQYALYDYGVMHDRRNSVLLKNIA